jgi:CubicO group peptidase (beta-lactamase class C family)
VPRPPDPEYWPTLDWQIASAEEADAAGFGAEAAEQLDAFARGSMPPIRAVVVVRHGKIVYERYYASCDKETYHSVFSVTKSVVSALYGIMLRDGLLQSLEQRVLDILPEYDHPGLDPRVRHLMVGHLLTMTSGYAHVHNVTPVPHQAPDFAEVALNRKLVAAPGTVFNYDDISAQLLSVVLTQLTGMSMAAYAWRELFEPLGIWSGEQAHFAWNGERADQLRAHPWGTWPDDGFLWQVDRQGHNFGGVGLHLTAREMAKFGFLYLHRGRWEGRQIVPEYYVRASAGYPRFTVPNVGRPYGLLWWIGMNGNIMAQGFGGQLIQVRPREHVVVAIARTPPWNTTDGLRHRIGLRVRPE